MTLLCVEGHLLIPRANWAYQDIFAHYQAKIMSMLGTGGKNHEHDCTENPFQNYLREWWEKVQWIKSSGQILSAFTTGLIRFPSDYLPKRWHDSQLCCEISSLTSILADAPLRPWPTQRQLEQFFRSYVSSLLSRFLDMYSHAWFVNISSVVCFYL